MNPAAHAAAPAPAKPRVNLRRPDVMELVSAEVARHYQSATVEKLRGRGGFLTIGNTTIHLAKEFGFCYGVERAIDLAYAARRVFPEQRMFLIGEIIHNQEVNRQLRDMHIVSLPWFELDASYDTLTDQDVVIVPAFGAPTAFMDKLEQRGCQVVDTTCGDVMKVWRHVREYAREGVTSIIHGKENHEETRATSSRALGERGDGQYLVVLTLEDADEVCNYIRGHGQRDAFLARFQHAHSPGFDPDLHLRRVGVANQTTMLKSETEEIQRRLRAAILQRDGDATGLRVFDTICGATQDRTTGFAHALLSDQPVSVGITAGASCPSNLIEATILRVFELRGVDRTVIANA